MKLSLFLAAAVVCISAFPQSARADEIPANVPRGSTEREKNDGSQSRRAIK
jgi:hypothetical protein